MFGKKKVQENPSLVLNPNQIQEENTIAQAYTQPIQQSQQFQQSIATQPYQPIQQIQPIQPVQKPKAEAIIIQGFITENNTFKYVVETNYPLSLGDCSLTQ